MNKKISIFGLFVSSLFLLSGCANQSLQPKTVTKVYIPSEDVKKAVAVLIYKQKELEKRVSNLENNKTIKKSFFKRKKGNQNQCKFNKNNSEKLFCDGKFEKNKYYIAVSNVNIRRCATLYSPIVGIVKKGEKVQFLHCNKYCWCFLRDNRGYVNKKFFKLENTLNKEEIKSSLEKKKETILNKKTKKTGNSKKVMNADEVIKNYINSK